MSRIRVAALPDGALLERYASAGAYTDCYLATVPIDATLADFMAAFYTTPIFRLERWILARLLDRPSSDCETRSLADGRLDRFAAWHVEDRRTGQALLAAGRTRSWLMATPLPGSPGSTTLFFGSAVVPRGRGGLGWRFTALLAFHRLYSRVLLASAVRRLLDRSP